MEKCQSNKYTANTAENSFRTDKALIISWVYQYNWIITETSKNALSKDICTAPGSNRAERPAYGGFSNAIVCVSYRQHPIMAEEKRSQESGRVREKT